MASSFTPQQIEEFLQEFFDVVGARQYIGARYVPIFGRAGEDTVEWDDRAPYEPLTVVMHEGVSYVSRRYVPMGIQVSDTDYWVETYRFNAQVEQYRQEVLSFQGQIDQVRADMESDYVPFPDSRTYPKYGTMGQVLTTLTGGGTKWEDPVTVDAAIAEPLIDEWLDSHPEATTTVQDGSIGFSKLDDMTKAALETSLAVRAPLVFDTTNKTLTVPAFTYVYVGKRQYEYRSSVTLDYSAITSSNRLSLVVDIDDSGNLAVKANSATGDWFRVFSFDANALTDPSTNDIPCGYIVDGVTYNDFTDSIGTLQKSMNVYMCALNTMSFNTAAQRLTIPHDAYFVIGNQRKMIEGNDLEIDYSTVNSNMVTIVYDTDDDTFAATLFNYVDLGTQVPVFSFLKNGLLRPQTNNIFYPYYVDGNLINGTDPDTYVIRYVAPNGSDSNPGTNVAPFKTIQKAINSSPNLIRVSRGTYPENLTISNKRNLKIEPWTTPTFNVSTFDVPMIVVNEVQLDYCINVELLDIHANSPQAGLGCIRANNCFDVTFDHCWASNGAGGGFVTVNHYGRFVMCKAWNIGDAEHHNSDGFNLHGYGVTELVDCIAHDCYDDGVSHHDGCIASIRGGEFWNCGHGSGGGIAPVNRYIEIDGAYCHDNQWGILATQADPTLYDPYILIKNCVLDDNTNYDLEIGEIECKMLRTTYTTKNIPAGATYKEIA